MGFLEDIFTEAGQNVGFAHSTIANDDDFYHIVVEVLLVVHFLQNAFVHGTQWLQNLNSIINICNYQIPLIMSSQTLNDSRFLVEEVNVDEEPTEEEIFDRAQELQIDDLLLAKESLTKELGSEWRPYRNRKKNIYYINLKERRAYVDHPIDMEYKILYAKKNSLLPPKFSSVKVEEVSMSMNLVEEEIRRFQEEENREVHLNIVYEEPSQEEESSKSRSKSIRISEQMEEELDTEDLQQFLQYKRQLENQYDRKLEEYRGEEKRKMASVKNQHEKTMSRMKKRAVREFEDLCEKEVGRKNDSDFEKQKEKIDKQLFVRKQQFIENMLKCRQLQQSIERKQYKLQILLREKREYQKISYFQSQHQQLYLYKSQQINKLFSQLKEELQQKVDRIVGGSQFYQKVLKDQLENLLPSKRPRRKSIFAKQNPNMQTKVETNFYARLEAQIENEKVWSQFSSMEMKRGEKKSSLNLRLWMRLI